MKTFFDSDCIECVEIEEAKKSYPDLNWEWVAQRFSWDIKNKVVIALYDLQYCVYLKVHNKTEEQLPYEEFNI